METIKAGLRPARAACAARGARPKLGALLRRHEKRLLGILFILPALCLLWQFSYGAFLQTVWNSVHLTNIQGQAVSFCGLEQLFGVRSSTSIGGAPVQSVISLSS